MDEWGRIKCRKPEKLSSHLTAAICATGKLVIKSRAESRSKARALRPPEKVRSGDFYDLMLIVWGRGGTFSDGLDEKLASPARQCVPFLSMHLPWGQSQGTGSRQKRLCSASRTLLPGRPMGPCPEPCCARWHLRGQAGRSLPTDLPVSHQIIIYL